VAVCFFFLGVDWDGGLFGGIVDVYQSGIGV
jgi:hypothetical protein